jgi:hypothetical protein
MSQGHFIGGVHLPGLINVCELRRPPAVQRLFREDAQHIQDGADISIIVLRGQVAVKQRRTP